MRTLFGFLAVTLTVATPAHSQEITPAETPGWVKALGSFVREGLAPPRTAADLAREEEERRMSAATQPAPPPADADKNDPPPMPTIEARPAPAPATALPAENPAPAPKVVPVAVAPTPIPPRPRPQVVVPVIQPPPAPVDPIDRISSTATLEQALKLGGSEQLYGRPLRKPAAD